MKKNKYEDVIIEDVEREDIFEFVDNRLIRLHFGEYLAVYGKRDLIVNLMTSYIDCGGNVRYIDIDMVDNSREDEIYLMMIRNDGRHNCSFSVEPAYSKKLNVLSHDAKVCLIYTDDCDSSNQDIVEYALDTEKTVVLFGTDDDWCDYHDEDDFDSDCEDCKCSDECSPDCEWYDECFSSKVGHIKADDATFIGKLKYDQTENEASTVIRGDDGKPKGFSKCWSSKDGNSESTTLFSYIGNNRKEVEELAELFGIKL